MAEHGRTLQPGLAELTSRIARLETDLARARRDLQRALPPPGYRWQVDPATRVPYLEAVGSTTTT